MAIYDLYGLSSIDIHEAKNLLEDALGLQFVLHDSSYQGGEYFGCGETAGEHFILKRNIDAFDGEPAETSFPEYSILFYVNDTTRSAELQERMTQKWKGIVLLRHEDLK